MTVVSSEKMGPDNQKTSLTKVIIYGIAGIYIASSLMGQSSPFFKNALVTVGKAKITDSDIFTHIHLLPLDPKAGKKQTTYAHVLYKASRMALLDQEVKTLGIRVSTQSAKEALAQNPVFDGTEKGIKDFLSKHRITLSQAIEYTKRKLCHQRLKKAIAQKTAPLSEEVLALRKRGSLQERKGIYRAFPITPEDIAAQTVSPQELAQYLAHNKNVPLPTYRTCTVLALDPKVTTTKQHIQDLSKDNPKDLLSWAQKKGLACHTIHMDQNGKNANQKPVSLPGIHPYRQTYNDLFFQKEQSAFTQEVFSHPAHEIFFHTLGKDLMYYVVQNTHIANPQTPTKEALEKEARHAIQRKKAWAQIQKKAEAFEKDASLQGTPITRFGFKPITINDITSDAIFLHDPKANQSMNQDFPWVAQFLFNLQPHQKTTQNFGVNADGNDTLYVVKATEITNVTPTQEKNANDFIAEKRLQARWVKRMWRSYVSSLEKKYGIQYQGGAIQSFFKRLNGSVQ